MTSLKSTVLFESCADAFWNSNHTGLGGGGRKVRPASQPCPVTHEE